MADINPISADRWTDIDEYLDPRSTPCGDALMAALHACDEAGLPAIGVAPNQGRLLQMLVRIVGARKILEIGTLGGYSTIWLAQGLPPDGKLVTLEIDSQHAAIAAANIDRAGLSDVVEILTGPALELLPEVEPEAPFDVCFIDADKKSTAEYFDWALRLSRPGSLIIVDNVVRRGAILDGSDDPSVVGVRRFHERLATERSVTATTLQTVGRKGHDGMTFVLVEAAGNPGSL